MSKQFSLFLTVAVFVTLGSIFLFFAALQADAILETQELKQAVCNVSPTKEGTYNQDGCKTAFNALPAEALCALGEIATVGTCTVNSGACTNSASRIGVWCTCTYTCSKRTISLVE